jgi:ligand-binding sensor domain-containing protein
VERQKLISILPRFLGITSHSPEAGDNFPGILLDKREISAMHHPPSAHFLSYAVLVLVALVTGCVPNKDITATATATGPVAPVASVSPTVEASPSPTSTVPPTATGPVWETLENGTAANQVRAMLIDRAGSLWTGGPGGVAHWDLKTGSPTVYAIREDPDNTNVVALSQTPDGAIWAGTSGNGLARFDGTHWQSFTVEKGLPGDYISDQAVTPDGELWLVIREKEYDYEPNQKIHLGHFDGRLWLGDVDVPGFTWLVASPDGSLISGMASNSYRYPNSNLYRYDRHDRKSWKSLVFDVPENRTLREQGITAVNVAPDAAIWAATWDAVLRYENGRWVRIPSPREKEDLPQVSSIAVSAGGVAWFGLSIGAGDVSKCGTSWDDPDFPEQGVYRYDGKTWTHFTTKDGLVDDKICAITLDQNGGVWFGSFDKGISRFDGHEWKSYRIPQ